MKKKLACLLLLPAVIAVGCRRDEPQINAPVPTATPTAPDSSDTLTLQMAAQSNSGQSGTATLTRVGSQTRVVLDLSNSPPGPQPAHIHDGTCPALGGVRYPLENVINGKSETTVNASLDDLVAGQFAINVHKSAQEAQVYTSCAEIKQ